MKVLLLSLLLVATSAKHKDYTGYRVVSVTPHHDHQVALLYSFHDFPEVSFWAEPAALGHKVTFSIAPEIYDDVTDKLGQAGLETEVVMENLQIEIDLERKLNDLQKDFSFNPLKYNRHADIDAHLEDLAKKYDFCSVISIGKSYEGRDMKLLKIGGPNTTQAVFLDGGIHAREWIAPAVSIYLIQQLVEGYDTDPNIRDLLTRITWYILPVLNPDGYEYSFTDERLWRKTRSRSDFCVGADANRNFGFHWMEGGASDNPCSNIYAGPRPFSEVEAANLAVFLRTTPGIGVYIALHAYGQLWLTPWGYTKTLPNDYHQLADMANVATAAIKRTSGRTYKVGASTRILYVASGGADDWAKGAAGIKYSYTVELRDTGRSGFLLPPTEIEPTGREIWAGMRAMVRALWG